MVDTEELWLVFENEGFSLTHFLFKTQPGSQASGPDGQIILRWHQDQFQQEVSSNIHLGGLCFGTITYKVAISKQFLNFYYCVTLCFQLTKCLFSTHGWAGGRALHILVADEAGLAMGWADHQELRLSAVARSLWDGLADSGRCLSSDSAWPLDDTKTRMTMFRGAQQKTGNLHLYTHVAK